MSIAALILSLIIVAVFIVVVVDAVQHYFEWKE